MREHTRFKVSISATTQRTLDHADLERDAAPGAAAAGQDGLWRERGHSFGGRQKRYTIHKHSLLRCWDPLVDCYVTFGRDELYRNWLLRRFDPDVHEIDVYPKPIAYLRCGQRFSATPHLTWMSTSGVRVAEWVHNDWLADKQARHQHFAQTHGVEVSLRSWSVLRNSSAVLLDNLDAARQNMTQHAGENLRLVRRQIGAHLRHMPVISRADLVAHFDGAADSPPADLVDTALYHMHCKRELQLEITEAYYGNATLIRRI